jgi:hypothetical protein
MTDRLGFLLWPAIAILAGCAITRPLDVALAGQPPERLQGDAVTLVEWKSAEAVGLRCAALQAQHGQMPTGAHGCAYRNAEGYAVLVLPRDLHPLISHELGHVHQMLAGEPVTHEDFR